MVIMGAPSTGPADRRYQIEMRLSKKSSMLGGTIAGARALATVKGTGGRMSLTKGLIFLINRLLSENSFVRRTATAELECV
jgi:hypothetical protein